MDVLYIIGKQKPNLCMTAEEVWHRQWQQGKLWFTTASTYPKGASLRVFNFFNDWNLTAVMILVQHWSASCLVTLVLGVITAKGEQEGAWFQVQGKPFSLRELHLPSMKWDMICQRVKSRTGKRCDPTLAQMASSKGWVCHSFLGGGREQSWKPVGTAPLIPCRNSLPWGQQVTGVSACSVSPFPSEIWLLHTAKGAVY